MSSGNHLEKKKKAHCKLTVYENNQQLNKGCQKMQTSSFKVSKSWGCNVQHDEYSHQHCMEQLKVRRVYLKRPHHKEKTTFLLCVVMDVNETYCGNHFATYLLTKSLQLCA